jgi:hypothetical protein
LLVAPRIATFVYVPFMYSVLVSVYMPGAIMMVSFDLSADTAA